MTKGERPCAAIEEECRKTWDKWQELKRRDLGGAPLVTKELGPETPPSSGTLTAEAIGYRRRYDDCAKRLRACYEENDVAPQDQRWPE